MDLLPFFALRYTAGFTLNLIFIELHKPKFSIQCSSSPLSTISKRQGFCTSLSVSWLRSSLFRPHQKKLIFFWRSLSTASSDDDSIIDQMVMMMATTTTATTDKIIITEEEVPSAAIAALP